MEQKRIKSEAITPIFFIAVFHFLGLIGLFVPAIQPLIIKLAPFSFLVLFVVLLYINFSAKRLFLIFALGVFICGFLVEILGVHAGPAFAKYQFGDVLGFRIAAVPLMMGMYFVILIYAAGQLMFYLPTRSVFVRAFAGSVALVIFDYFLEPAADRFNYWRWDAGIVPYQNYLAWFLLCFVLLQLFYAIHLPVKKKSGAVLFVAQLVVFMTLYLSKI